MPTALGVGRCRVLSRRCRASKPPRATARAADIVVRLGYDDAVLCTGVVADAATCGFVRRWPSTQALIMTFE